MKRILSIILTLVLMLTLGSVAMADGAGQTEQNSYTDMTEVKITKVYQLVGAGSSPAETFTLEQVGAGSVTSGEATSAPNLGAITGAEFDANAATADGAEGTITIQLPQYDNVGVYEYTLKEVAGTTAGVAYYGGNIRLVVTVINDESTGKLRIAAVHTEGEGGEKSNEFTNTYSAGTLNISKTVTGNLGDHNKYFTFKVTLTGEDGKTYPENFAVTGGSNSSNPTSIKLGAETTFLLKHGDTIKIENLPYGVEYEVTEVEATGYTTTKTGDTGTINDGSQTAAFTNNNNSGTIDTGITTDNMPYIVLLGVVMLAGAAMLLKRRSYNN